jgi:hypothetical protein
MMCMHPGGLVQVPAPNHAALAKHSGTFVNATQQLGLLPKVTVCSGWHQRVGKQENAIVLKMMQRKQALLFIYVGDKKEVQRVKL